MKKNIMNIVDERSVIAFKRHENEALMIDFSNDVVLFLLLIFLLFLAPTVQFVSFKLHVLDRTTRSLSSYRLLPLFRLLF